MVEKWHLEDIGRRIREKREKLRLTQEKAAEILDVSVTHYKNIEHGRSGMSIEVLMDICDKFDMAPDYVLYGKEIVQNPIVDLYERLPREKRQFFNRAMYYLSRVYEK